MIPVKKTVISALSGVVILLISVCLIIYMRTSPRFEITRVGVRGNSKLMPASIVAYLDIQPHTNIFQIQPGKLQQRLETLQWVKTVKVFRNFPDKISIDVTERTPFALLKLDQLHLVDGDGVFLGALASGSPITLPIITGTFIERLEPDGENPKLGLALYALREFMDTSLPIFQNIRKIQIRSLENATLISYDEAYPEIRVSLTNYSQNLQRLQRIYPTLHPETLTSIDLRFDRRIIVKSNKS